MKIISVREKSRLGDLPEDIIRLVFRYLDSRAYFRFRSLNKEWYNVLTGPRFYNAQLKALLTKEYYKSVMIISGDNKKFFVLNRIGNAIERVYQFSRFGGRSCHRVLGCCSGLLCLGLTNKKSCLLTPILWNPLLSEFRKINGFDVERSNTLFGFGCVKGLEDFKFVKVDLSASSPLVLVYNFRTNLVNSYHLERDIPFVFDGETRMEAIPSKVGRLYQGCLYWVILIGKRHVLVVFDVKVERFSFVDLPYYGYFPVFGARLCMLGSSLRVFLNDSRQGYFHMLTLVSEEEKSWSIRQFPKVDFSDEPIAHLNDKILLRHMSSYPNYDFVIFDPVQRTVENFSVGDVNGPFEYTTFMETSVSPLTDID